jgi:CheY-like chemotaxis protein
VVLDLGLPGDDPVDLLHVLDTDPALRSVPVLVHHSHPLSPAQQHRLRARAGSHPLEMLTSLDELRERMVLHLTAEHPGDALALVPRPENEPEPTPLEADSLTGRTVLIVDDDTRNVFALTGILELHGIRVLHADNGRKGIETLAANADIDLVLMDAMMPEMDGYAAIAAIRSQPGGAHLPVIAVTAKAMPGDREKCLSAGANDYVTKPLDAKELISRVLHWLDL